MSETTEFGCQAEESSSMFSTALAAPQDGCHDSEIFVVGLDDVNDFIPVDRLEELFPEGDVF